MQTLCRPIKSHTEWNLRGAKYPLESIEWLMSVPFGYSLRGKCYHRIRTGNSQFRNGEFKYHCVHYWCDGSGIGNSLILCEYPPSTHRLCASCEAKAVRMGETPTDTLLKLFEQSLSTP